jgi:hypothetical protein
MGCNQQTFTLVWRWNQPLSGSLPYGSLSRVSHRLKARQEIFTLPTYLGTYINEYNWKGNEFGHEYWWNEIWKIWNSYSVQTLLSSRLLSKNLKIKIYKTIILPDVLYGCETWSLTLRKECRLRIFENWNLRRIFGRKRDEIGEREGSTMRNFIVCIVHLLSG